MIKPMKIKEQGLAKLGEFGLIEQLTASFKEGAHVIVGVGDDAAVLKRDAKTYSLFACDALVEGVHFSRSMSLQEVGHKALAVNLSDIAAMGGVPESAVVTLGVNPKIPVRFYKALYQGLQKAANPYGVSIVGGDTVRSPVLFVNVALIGWVEKKNCILRKGARLGDAICVTGSLGGSLTKKHLNFAPRLKEARALVQKVRLHAMIDLSDGVASDLTHILKQSQVGARLFLEKLPLSSATAGKKRRIEAALYDGEDFELLFTLPKSEVQKAQAIFKQSKGFPTITEIGEIVAARFGWCGVDAQGKEAVIKPKGYVHF